MKTAILIQSTDRAITGIKETEAAIRTAFEKQRHDLLRKKSIRVIKWDMQVGQNGDDFVKNMISVMFTGNGYRVPRIVKRLFKKK